MLTEYRSKFAKLALQQFPDALFIARCDNSVVSNVFASSDSGNLFVLRNIGNLIPPYQINFRGTCKTNTSVASAIEFSLLSLNVQDIIICGHSECGAMHALIENTKKSPYLHAWLQYAALSYERFKKVTI